jgi:hypothetical protein
MRGMIDHGDDADATVGTRPDHRWSGSPGALCLDCGVPDRREICLMGGCDCGAHVFDAWARRWVPPLRDNAPCRGRQTP